MPIRQADIESIDTIFNVNILSVLELIRPLVKKENKGSLKHILFISSLASIRGEKGNAVYAASKGALNALAITLAKELAPKVRVNSISPGTVETPMTQTFLASEAGAAHLATYPLGVGHPEDITSLACFLLSEEARWITGQIKNNSDTAITVSGENSQLLLSGLNVNNNGNGILINDGGFLRGGMIKSENNTTGKGLELSGNGSNIQYLYKLELNNNEIG